jgi:hypothetical protein
VHDAPGPIGAIGDRPVDRWPRIFVPGEQVAHNAACLAGHMPRKHPNELALRSARQVLDLGQPCDVDVVIGKKRVPAVLALGHRCDSEGGSDSFQRADVVAVRLSPDRLKIAVTLRVRSKSMEWFGLSDVTKVLDATP